MCGFSSPPGICKPPAPDGKTEACSGEQSQKTEVRRLAAGPGREWVPLVPDYQSQPLLPTHELCDFGKLYTRCFYSLLCKRMMLRVCWSPRKRHTRSAGEMV